MRPRRMIGSIALAVPLLGASWFLAACAPAPGEQRGALLRASLGDNAADFWIYDDLDRGYARAADTGKPLLVSLRCVP